MKILFVLFISFISIELSFSQSNYSSLDTPVDARSISMGESFVAINNSISGIFYNPATLSSIKGITASFSKKDLNWMKFDNGVYYLSMNATIKTSYGTFGIFYNKFKWGNVSIIDENGADLGTANIYDHTYGIDCAKEIIPNLSVGIVFKTYDNVEDQIITIRPLNFPKTTSHPYLIDLGLLYRLPILSKSENFTDQLSLGLSFQNFGTDYRINEKYQRIPHYGRMGFSYTFVVEKKNEESLTPFRYTLTGQYCNHLNAWKTMRDAIDYWGTGMEATFYEIISLRIGGYAWPYTNVYGIKGNPSFRYGFGINAPLRKFGVETPLVATFDYALIPLSYASYWFSTNPKKNLTAFSFELRYEEDLF